MDFYISGDTDNNMDYLIICDYFSLESYLIPLITYIIIEKLKCIHLSITIKNIYESKLINNQIYI